MNDVTPIDLVLASGSPRRIEMIASLGLHFETIPADIDETPFVDEDPMAYVARLAREKSAAVAAILVDHVPVLGADTTVVLDGEIIGKPADNQEATLILKRLGGRTHLVHTSVALRTAADVLQTTVTTEVEFAELDAAIIDWYVGLGQSLDKAGAYGLQGPAAVLVAGIRGSVSNVVGLPMNETLALLAQAGLAPRGLSGF